jgi:hypothetical protein
MPLPKPEKLDEDERQSPRYPLERVAKLEPPDGARVRHCLVIDMSDGHSIGRARCPGRAACAGICQKRRGLGCALTSRLGIRRIIVTGVVP